MNGDSAGNPMAGGSSAGDVDRISDLPDDLLHLILSYVSDDAAEVTRTSVLSRRWRRVWIHAQKLCFDDDRQSRWRRLANFGGFVDWAFAQRGDADIQSVIIFMSRLDSATPEQVNEWLRYAVRRVVKTFWFNACDSTPIGAWWAPPPRDHGHQLPTVELPSHGRTASINLNLSSYPFRLKLPASPAARYEALTDLSLSSAWFGEDEAVAGRRTLADFISSCCPRLRKQIIDPMRLPQLVLRAEALEELIVASTRDTQTMDVTAPNLRIFELHYFNSMTSVTSYGESIDLVVRITAPRLEEIAINNSTLEIEDNLDLRIHGLASVRRLKNLTLAMHGHNCCNTDYGLWLLNNCPNVEHIDLRLRYEMLATHEVDDLTDNGAPRLYKARSMVIDACGLDQYLVTSV
ncbi:F-box/LRR-repeat protein 13-like [Oryza glaberrima]|uniref:F-box/LRR-repeat protein 13-like n=1 Tax=Oryza glaberrima TaxID=4538 RepID=UPI00224C42F6|nr:F-box/LRR-repeat protein 13-like [Oryza glaberrima]